MFYHNNPVLHILANECLLLPVCEGGGGRRVQY